MIYVNLTDDTTERIPSYLPEFPRLFYEKCIQKKAAEEPEQDKKDGIEKGFDLRVSFLLVREHERVDLIIEYFNEKLKKINKQQMQSSEHPQSEVNHLDDQSNLHDSLSQFEAANNFNLKLQAQELEKEFVFNFRTFREVFPYISSVCINDHYDIEEAYEK